MTPNHQFVKDVVDRASETGAPLVVRRRCNPHQLAVWMAVRFLLDTTNRSAFGSREIAREANLSSYPRVAAWLGDLVEMGLLEIAGYEEIQGGSIQGGKHDRPIYRIPFRKILDNSTAEAERYVIETTNKRRKRKASGSHEGQLALDLAVIDRSQEAVTDRSQAVIDRSQEHEQTRDRSVTLEGRREGSWKEGESARARKKVGRPPKEPPPLIPPPPPPDAPSLPAHPFDIWERSCTKLQRNYIDQLAALAAEHDMATDGHGMYWVGKAILQGSINEEIQTLGKLKRILNRWRDESSYGSDLKETTNGRQDTTPRPKRSPDAERHSGRSNGRPRPGEPGYRGRS